MITINETRELRNKTGCGITDCYKALKYAESNLNNRDKFKLAIAVLKSKGLALYTRGLNEDERIDMFYEMEVYNGKR